MTVFYTGDKTEKKSVLSALTMFHVGEAFNDDLHVAVSFSPGIQDPKSFHIFSQRENYVKKMVTPRNVLVILEICLL